MTSSSSSQIVSQKVQFKKRKIKPKTEMIKVMKKNCAVANLNKLLNNFLNWQLRHPPPPLQNQPSTTHAKPLKMNVKPPLISEPDVMEFLLDVFGDQSKKPKNSKSADCNSVMVHQWLWARLLGGLPLLHTYCYWYCYWSNAILIWERPHFLQYVILVENNL